MAKNWPKTTTTGQNMAKKWPEITKKSKILAKITKNGEKLDINHQKSLKITQKLPKRTENN